MHSVFVKSYKYVKLLENKLETSNSTIVNFFFHVYIKSKVYMDKIKFPCLNVKNIDPIHKYFKGFRRIPPLSFFKNTFSQKSIWIKLVNVNFYLCCQRIYF